MFGSFVSTHTQLAPHHIVIVGGGAGGLELAARLGKHFARSPQIRITLIDQRLTHIWKPLLHEIAAGTLHPHQEEIHYYAHATSHHYQFILGQLEQIDPPRHSITLRKTQTSTEKVTYQRLHYDTLFLAVGSVSNDFATPGVKQYCHSLDNANDAQAFQQQMLQFYLDAQDPTWIQNSTHSAPHSPIPSNLISDKGLHIAIIGAGATGVELAAELVQAKNTYNQYGLNNIPPEYVKITLIEAAERILPALSTTISAHSQRQLQHLQVKIITAKKVAKVDDQSVYFSDGSHIPAQLKVWTAGIRAPSILKKLNGFPTDAIGRLEVYATLQTKADPDIFALGDCAHCQLDAHAPALGPRAQVASQQATFLLEATKARLAGRALPMFHFFDRGALISLSPKEAVGELLGMRVHGLLAKILYLSLYRIHQMHISSCRRAVLMSIKDFVTRKVTPKIKLH